MPVKLKVPHEVLFNRIAQNIAKEGRQIIGVSGSKKDPPFAYTIGNQEKQLPELLLILDLPATDMAAILNQLSDHMVETKSAWSTGEHVYGNYHFKAYDGGSAAKARYTYQAGQFYNNQDYDVLQIVLPDDKGLWPNDPSCHRSFRVPILELTGGAKFLR